MKTLLNCSIAIFAFAAALWMMAKAVGAWMNLRK